jgi:nitric oxide reductase subunit B
MRYESQRIAWWFFATCMLLFSLQIVYGFIMGFAHAGYDVLHDVIPFHTARATHTNLLVMWLLVGFMGAAYYIVPEECERELMWPWLAYVQLGAFVAVGVTAIVGFHFNWWEGRKFLEIPRPLDFLVVVDVLLFIANIGVTIWRGQAHDTTTSDGAVLRPADGRAAVPAGHDPDRQPDGRLLLALVGRAPLGRGRVGADHGRASCRSS